MILPIMRYGHQILRNKAKPITIDYPNLQGIINNMWETLYTTKGVGLAAPQINEPIQLFIVDSEQMFRDDKELEKKYPDAPGIKQVFINPKILDEAGPLWFYEEGCLSFPDVRTMIERKQHLTISFVDENFIQHTLPFSGITARIIFHEYDHLEGKLFIDKATPLRKKILASRLNQIQKGKISTFYKII